MKRKQPTPNYPLPWTSEYSGAGITIKDANGDQILFIYGEAGKQRKLAASLLELSQLNIVRIP